MKCAVVGHPIEHSLSPRLYRGGYRAAGLDWSFEAIDVPAGGLADFVAGLDPAVWRGLAVTAPLKPELLSLGVADSRSRLAGGGNTLVLGEIPDQNRVYNTDVLGAGLALRKHDVFEVDSAVILGAGTTARSMVVMLKQFGCEVLDILVRDPSRADAIVNLANHLGIQVSVAKLGEVFESDLLISTLPVGVEGPYAVDLIEASDAVFEVSYAAESQLAELSHNEGVPYIGGLDLLIGQGFYQFKRMTGVAVDSQVLMEAVLFGED